MNYYPQQPPVRPSTGLPAIAWIAIAAGAMILLGIMGAFVYGVAQGFRKASREASTDVAGPLSESYTSANGVIVAHYPKGFAAKKIENSSVLVSHNLGDGTDEGLALTAIPNPISDDVKEVARVILAATNKSIDYDAAHEKLTPGTCLGKYAGLEISGHFTVTPSSYSDHICFFMDQGRAYEVRTWVPRKSEKQHTSEIDRIALATELK